MQTDATTANNVGPNATSTFSIMHLNCPPPPPPQKKKHLHNLCFLLLLGITAVPREIENNFYAKFWGANKAWVPYDSYERYDRCDR